MNFNIAFNFTYNENILESIFLKYLPHHQFFILYSSKTCMKFVDVKDIISFLISQSSIYFYKHLVIQILSDNHVLFEKKIILFRNLMYFDNYLTNLLENFVLIKMQNIVIGHHLKNIINVTFKNFLNNETYLYIYKTYYNNTVIYIENNNYSFQPFIISNYLLEEIFTYFVYENDSINIRFNNREIYSVMYKTKENTIKSIYIQKLIPLIVKKFKCSTILLEKFHTILIYHSAHIIQKQAKKSLYDPKFSLCRKILTELHNKICI